MKRFEFETTIDAVVRVQAADEDSARKAVPTVLAAPGIADIRIANENVIAGLGIDATSSPRFRHRSKRISPQSPSPFNSLRHATTEARDFLSRADLPLNFHPAAIRASANVTPFGAVSVPA
jgi:hypothetical protein